MNDILKYKDYLASVHFSVDDDVFYGKVLGVDDLINFEGSSVKELKRAFHEAIDDYISYKTSGAHSPYHLVFWIKEGNETIFYGGDVAPQLQQMKSRFVAKYDFDGKKAMELRTSWWQQAQQEHWKMLFYHDIKTPTIGL